MPIEIQDCDGGIGNIILSKGMVTDQELIQSLKNHLSQDKDKYKKYKYILIDNTELAKVVFTDKTVEFIAGQFADDARVNPDTVVAMVVYVAMEANMGLIDGISRMREIFINQSCWETVLFRTKNEAVRWIRLKVRDKFGIDNLTFV